jgi:hypothetical protein
MISGENVMGHGWCRALNERPGEGLGRGYFSKIQKIGDNRVSAAMGVLPSLHFRNPGFPLSADILFCHEQRPLPAPPP